jgi:hypothetical protein
MTSRKAHGPKRVTGDAFPVTRDAAHHPDPVQHARDTAVPGAARALVTRTPITGVGPGNQHGHDTACESAGVRRSSVIVLGPRSVRVQRAGRYVAGTTAHPTRLAPDLAATPIEVYSRPGSLILDPLAGTGTVLIEAIHKGRNALGLADDPGWVALARANLALARRHGATGHGRVLAGQATRLPAELHGQIDLVLTSPPPAHTLPVTHRPVTPQTPARRRVRLRDRLTATLSGCRPMLAPTGLVVVVARPWYRDGVLTDQTAVVVQAGQAGGLTLIACHRAIRHPRPDDDTGAVPGACDTATERPPSLGTAVAVGHYDVAIFPPRRLPALGGGDHA